MGRFHEKTLRMLPKRPRRSEKNAALLKQREKALGIRFPASVREWYVLEGSVPLLRKYSNEDSPIALRNLGSPVDDWYGGGRRDFVSRSLLWFMAENQGVCNWFVKLDGEEDPEVLVEVDTAPKDVLVPTSTSFSEFVWCQVWDHLPCRTRCAAFGADVRAADLRMLRTRFVAERTTTGWPGDVQYRFQSDAGRILILDGEASHDWFLMANSVAGLRALLDAVWGCRKVARTLHGVDKTAERALDELRARVKP